MKINVLIGLFLASMFSINSMAIENCRYRCTDCGAGGQINSNNQAEADTKCEIECGTGGARIPLDCKSGSGSALPVGNNQQVNQIKTQEKPITKRR